MVTNILDYLKETLENTPDKTAFIDEKERVSYSQLDIRARKFAMQIIGSGNMNKMMPVAVYMPKSALCISAFLGAVYSGNFYVPLDIKSPGDRLKKICGVLKPSCIVTVEEYKVRAMELAPEASIITYRDSQSIDGEKLQEILCRHIDMNPLYVLFTSGSTGMPKGVVISHRSVIDYTEWLSEFFDFNSDTVIGNQAPFHFDNSILDIYGTIRNGGTMYMIPEISFTFAGELIHNLDREQVNTIFWVPSALIQTANSGILSKNPPSYLKKILFCGEVMPNKQLNIWRKAVPDAFYANLYGPTEITDVAACYVVDRQFGDDEPLPIGFPCKNTQLLVLNEKDQLCKTDEIGELCVRGSCNALGYYCSKSKTEEVFVQNPLNHAWEDKIYRTGDLVKYNNRQELIFIGRKDFQIKYRGHRIELGEIEMAAYALPGIMQCCALFCPDDNGILLFCASDTQIKEQSVYQHLKKKLPRYMLPSKIIFIEEFPVNANGKTDRKKLENFYRGKGKEKQHD